MHSIRLFEKSISYFLYNTARSMYEFWKYQYSYNICRCEGHFSDFLVPLCRTQTSIKLLLLILYGLDYNEM